jgi:hypothetical protein
MRWIDPLRHEPWTPPLFAVRTAEGKFLVHRPERGEARPMLRFDLADDPGERSPLPVAAERARAVDALVTRYLRSATDTPTAQPRRADDVSPELRQRLRALGYWE